MTLGQKLIDNMNKIGEEKIRLDNEKIAKENEKVRADREKVGIFFSNVLKKIEINIDSGEVPKKIRLDYRTLPEFFSSPVIGFPVIGEDVPKKIAKSLYGDLYEDIVKVWEKNNDLVLNFQHAHDGGGNESWYEITVSPTPTLIATNSTRKLKR